MQTELPKPVNKKFDLFYPIKWIWKGYETEFKKWSSPNMMVLYFITQAVVFPTIFFTGFAVFSFDNLPEKKFEFLIGAFGLTASIAGLCSIKLTQRESHRLEIARLKFTFAALALLICTAVVFLIDYYTDPKFLKSVATVLVQILRLYYSFLIASIFFLWMGAFGTLNTTFWYYLYNDKYHQDAETEAHEVE